MLEFMRLIVKFRILVDVADDFVPRFKAIALQDSARVTVI
jgi:hypothetical protein